MGRPRKPTAMLKASGALAKNPQRYRDREEEPVITTPLGDPPADFMKAESPTSRDLLAIWKELEAEAIPGTLTVADRLHFEMTCRLTYRCRRPGAKPSDFNALNRHLSQMGKNPSDRSRIAQRRAKEADKANRVCRSVLIYINEIYIQQ